MSDDIDLKKLGLKHLRKAEELEELIKRGLRSVEFKGGKCVAKVEIRYKNSIGGVNYEADTFCDVIEKAHAVHVENK